MALPSRERSLTISSAVWVQCTNVTDGRTIGRTLGDTQRLRLRIASRGKMIFSLNYHSAPREQQFLLVWREYSYSHSVERVERFVECNATTDKE